MNRSMARSLGMGALLLALAACGKDKIQGIQTEDPVNYDTDGGLITPSSKTCATILDCGLGEICDQVDLTCQPDCNSTPLPPACGGGTDGGVTCNCVAPQVCRNGACVDPGACGTSPDVKAGAATGATAWTTYYNLKLSQLLGIGSGFTQGLDTLDNFFQGHISNDPVVSALAAGAAGWVKSHLPTWLPDVVHFLNALIQMFDNSEIMGTMSLTPQPGTPDIYDGTESWDTFITYNIDRCPRGTSDPNYPNCARDNVSLTGTFVVGTSVIKMTNSVANFVASVCGSTFSADSRSGTMRQATLSLGNLLYVFVNRVIVQMTGYNLRDALMHLVNCNSLSWAITTDTFLRPALESACNSALGSLVNQIDGAISGVKTNFTLQWNQSASILVQGGTARGFAQIIQATPVSVKGTGTLTGGNVSGSWGGER